MLSLSSDARRRVGARGQFDPKAWHGTISLCSTHLPPREVFVRDASFHPGAARVLVYGGGRGVFPAHFWGRCSTRGAHDLAQVMGPSHLCERFFLACGCRVMFWRVVILSRPASSCFGVWSSYLVLPLLPAYPYPSTCSLVLHASLIVHPSSFDASVISYYATCFFLCRNLQYSVDGPLAFTT